MRCGMFSARRAAAMSEVETEIDAERDEEPRAWDLATTLSRNQLLCETVVVFCLAVLPAWFYGFAGLVWPGTAEPTFVDDMLSSLVLSVQVCAPVLYLIGRSGERWSDFGLARPRWILDPLGGLGVWMFNTILISWLTGLLAVFLNRDQFEALTAGHDSSFSVPRSAGEHALLIVGIAAGAFAEELVVRGYLIRRFEQLLRSTWLSVLITTVLFAGYHSYQGPGGVFRTAVAGFVYAGAFCLVRRLWPVVLAHMLHNLIAYL
jgi:membrane protease YdiL (CAAX protease family)